MEIKGRKAGYDVYIEYQEPKSFKKWEEAKQYFNEAVKHNPEAFVELREAIYFPDIKVTRFILINTTNYPESIRRNFLNFIF